MRFLRTQSLFSRFSGFTLVEALVFLFIFTVITLIFFQTFAYGTALIQQSKYRLGAIALGNQKMEIVRSLDYANIGTTHGIPPGSLAEDEDIQVNNALYHVHTFVQYVDDSFDGILGGSPNDLIPNDYKRVRIEVTWGNATTEQTIGLASTIAPQGVEQSAGGGILSINILDSQGNGVSNADVHITNSTIAPSVDVTPATDTSGNVFLVGAKASSQKYHVAFSKSGYYGSLTYDPYPTSTFVPIDVHASVVNNVVNQATFVMDRVVSLQLRTKDPLGTDLPNIHFRLDGGRQIGTVAGSIPPVPVYGFGQDGVTDGSGQKDYSNESYGGYTWTLKSSETNYEFVRLNPELTTGANNFQAAPGGATAVTMILADKNVPGLLVTVNQASDHTPLVGASVRLHDAALTYDATVTTSQYGKAYFPNSSTPLAVGSYTLEVSASGFSADTSTVGIGSTLNATTVELSP